MQPNVKDLATSLITVAPSPALSGTTLTVTPGEGARFPAVPFDAILHPVLSMPTIDVGEKIVVTKIVGDVFTITRAQGVTSAQSITVGWRISNGIFGSHVVNAYLQKPKPLGSRVIGMGDSIMAGVSPSGQLGSAGPYTDSRPNQNAWFNRLCFGNPKRYYRLRNAGVGGDNTGGYGTLVTGIPIGATSATVRVVKGNVLFTNGFFFFGDLTATNNYQQSSTVTNNGDGTFTVTWSVATANAWTAESPVGWGMLGRLQADVIRWKPDMCLIMAGTNDTNNNTAQQTVNALMDMASDLRAANIEPIFLEVLPRVTLPAQVPPINDALRYACRTYAGGPLHLIPMYDVFAGSDGKFVSNSYTADGLHPSPTGNVMIANLVDKYLSRLPMRLDHVPSAANNTDSTNLLQNTNFLTGSAALGGLVPTGWTLTQFFTTLTVPNIVTPAPTDGIKGNWFQFVCSAGAAGGTTIYQALSSAPAVGDTLLMTCRIRTKDLAGGMVVTIQYLDGLFNNDLVYQLAEDVDEVLISATAKVSSAGNNAFSIGVAPNGGSGTVMVAEPFVQNMTQLGRIP